MKLVKPIAHSLYHTISCYWLLILLGADTQTPILMHEPKQFQETKHAFGLAHGLKTEKIGLATMHRGIARKLHVMQ